MNPIENKHVEFQELANVKYCSNDWHINVHGLWKDKHVYSLQMVITNRNKYQIE